MPKATRQPRTPTELVAHWTDLARDHLVNRCIVDVRYLTAAECDQFGWSCASICLKLDNDTQIVVQADDEGNGPGALLLDVAPAERQVLLPVCPAV